MEIVPQKSKVMTINQDELEFDSVKWHTVKISVDLTVNTGNGCQYMYRKFYGRL